MMYGQFTRNTTVLDYFVRSQVHKKRLTPSNFAPSRRLHFQKSIRAKHQISEYDCRKLICEQAQNLKGIHAYF